MKILLFGRGVVSTQYAWAFEKAGHTVEFYVRRGRLLEFGETVALNMYDARKKITGVLVNENWKIKLREELPANHDYELILVSVQHYHLKDVTDFLSDKIGNATVLIFNNVWEEPQQAVATLPKSRLVWGFPQAGGGFDNKGVLNGSLFSGVTIGTFGEQQTARGTEVIKLLKSSGFKVKESNDFRTYLLSHFVVGAAMSLELLKSKKGLTLSSLGELKTTEYWRNVLRNGKELLPILKARNVDVKTSAELKLFNSPPWILGFSMRMINKFVPSVLQSMTGHSNLVESKSYCKDVLATAEEMKITLPRYEASRELYSPS